ncbi:hypothetical protein JOM56_013591 [Amanita muscaria]
MVTTSNKENSAPPPRPRTRSKQGKEAEVATAAKKAAKKPTTKAAAKAATKAAAKAISQTAKTATTTAAAKTAANAKQTTTLNDNLPPATSSSAEDQSSTLQAEVNRLQRELESLRKEKDLNSQQDDETDLLISRPFASDFCLQKAMGLVDDDIKYKYLRCVVRESVNISGADPKRTWRNQDFVKLAGIKHIVLEREPYFYRYTEEWPIAEFIRRNLKNVRAYQKQLESEVQTNGDEGQGVENGDEGGHGDDVNEDENMHGDANEGDEHAEGNVAGNPEPLQ